VITGEIGTEQKTQIQIGGWGDSFFILLSFDLWVQVSVPQHFLNKHGLVWVCVMLLCDEMQGVHFCVPR
jgi:hypothetical protein